MKLDPKIEQVLSYFSLIYINGIPPMVTDASAYLSFICTFCAVDALAGYRHGPNVRIGLRFKKFVATYFSDEYVGLDKQLYGLRNSMVHAFSASHFELTHNHPELHFTTKNQRTLLDAACFYTDMKKAADKYFAEMKSSADLQGLFIQYVDAENGGITVGPTGPAGIVVTGGMW
jgi:hypothetical protein